VDFFSITEESDKELEERTLNDGKRLPFGIPVLDDAAYGILSDDLVLIGAPSGAGKTQLCCNIALAVMTEGKKVNYIALEASEFEITRRLKYKMVMDYYFSDPNRPRIEKISYTSWYAGEHVKEMKEYEDAANNFFKSSYGNLSLYRKGERFGVTEMIESVLQSDNADLIIIDHVHYFDFDSENENAAVKEIARTARNLAVEQKRPIVLVAHLRKKDRGNKELCPGQEEFHGSSDLYKMASKVITMAPGKPTDDGKFITYFRAAKVRTDGGVSRFLLKTKFCPKKGGYENEYTIGWPGDTFKEVEPEVYPNWARRFGSSSGSVSISKKQFIPYADN
jgi:KaiC/GvpD/RAD55 family RecA-like ATPase